MSKPAEIPTYCYDTMRAIFESRFRRAHGYDETPIPHLTVRNIFDAMPDRDNLDWSRDVQPAITEGALTTLLATHIEV